mgnify:FL=1
MNVIGAMEGKCQSLLSMTKQRVSHLRKERNYDRNFVILS